jgi:carbon monoxide dehydrogenase subunit G
MRIENEFTLTAPLDQVWEHLQDVPGLAPCLPGAELTGEVGDDVYEGKVLVRLGPVSLRFTGTARIVETDEAARRIVLHATGSEVKGKGTADMTVTSVLVPAGAGATTLKVSQDLQVSGAAAQYGRGMIADVTSVLLRSFTDCIAQDVNSRNAGAPGSGGGGAATATRTAAAPASGLRIGIAAALLGLRRVLRRFFGPSTRP